MMRAVYGLLLLFLGLCGSGAQGDEGDTEQTSKQTSTDLWSELRALRDMVVELKVQLSAMEEIVKDSESLVDDLRAELIVTNVHVEQLQKENSAQATELSSLAMRLSVSESTTKEMKEETADLQTRLRSTESDLNGSKSRIAQLEEDAEAKAAELKSLELRLTDTESRIRELEEENTDLQSELLISTSRIDQLEKENAEKTEIAFYTALTDSGHVGPYNTHITLKYSKVYTNIGNAYNPATGFFTAPVKGIYYLQFTGGGYGSKDSAVYLYRNNQRIMMNHVWQPTPMAYYTNSVVLELNAGEEIYLVLPAGYAVYDDVNNQSTFSGFLLFQH